MTNVATFSCVLFHKCSTSLHKCLRKLELNVEGCLVRPYFGRGYHVYSDNFFTSVPLVQELARHHTLACGTVRMNQNELPADVKKMKPKMPGELLTRQSENLLLTM